MPCYIYRVANDSHKKPAITAGYGLSQPYRRTLALVQNFSLFLKPKKTPYMAVWDFKIRSWKIENRFPDFILDKDMPFKSPQHSLESRKIVWQYQDSRNI